jgi:hypothetical protein
MKQLHAGRTLRQGQQFLDARADVVGPANESEARTALDDAVKRFDTAVVEQGTHAREGHGQVSLREQQEGRMRRKFMRPLSKLARSRLQASANFAALTPSGNAMSSERLAASARSMINAARPYAAELTAAKFPVDFLDRFAEAADAIAATMQERAARNKDRSGASKEIQAALQQGRTALAELDALVSHLILGNARLEEEWRVATRITKSTGTRSRTAAAPSVPTASMSANDAPTTLTAPAATATQEARAAA